MIYQIIDDVIDKQTQDRIEEALYQPEINWSYGKYLNYRNHPEVSDDQRSKIMSFSNIMVTDGKILTDNFNLFVAPIVGACERLQLKINSLFNMRAQMQLPSVIDQGAHGIPHVDCYAPKPYIVMVYYVNDTDGETRIFNETVYNSTPEKIQNGGLTIREIVSPKKGRIIVMDGAIYHASGRPKTNDRIVLNYNLFVEGIND